MNNPTDSLEDLQQVANKTSGFLNKANLASEIADSKKTSVLFGTAGAIIGSLIGVFAATYVGIPLLLISTPITALGIIGGILTYRGRDGIIQERILSNNRKHAHEVLNQIKALPKGTPQEVCDDLWSHYRELNEAFKNQAVIALPPPKKKSEGLLLTDKTNKNTPNK